VTAVLDAFDLHVRFGGVRALEGMSMSVGEGEIVGLIGPNGAGKTTLFECLAGFTAPLRGKVTLLGRDVTKIRPEERARRGLIRSFQDARMFESLTVFQTVLVASEKQHPSHLLPNLFSLPRSRRVEDGKAEVADHFIELMGLMPYRDKQIAELSTGTRRITELACIIALEPKVLLLDEPSSGIAQREVEALGALLLRIKDATGCTMVVIEHDMPMIMGLADRIVALESGRFLAEGTPDEIRHHPAVVASYLGTAAAAIERSGSAPKRKKEPTA
jgi:ABC-type branched-subunit amino acid transport system ATPase component